MGLSKHSCLNASCKLVVVKSSCLGLKACTWHFLSAIYLTCKFDSMPAILGQRCMPS